MTSKAKVVSLGHRPGSPEATRLLNECRGLANRQLTECIQELFQKNDDTLFGFAEKSSGEESNARYMDAMRALRLKKDEISRGFLERVTRNFARLQSATAEDDAGAPQTPVTLTLLDDSELEESLAIQSMAEKVESGCAEELSPLRQRLGSVMGGAPLEAREDPLGPARLSEAYREALRVVDTDIEVRLVLYKLFDKVVLAQVDELYSDLNALLAKNGVMPEFKLQPRPDRARAKRKEKVEENQEETAAELLPLLRNLLTQQRGGTGTGGGGSGGGMGGGGGEGTGAPLDAGAVMSALTSLQQQIRAIQTDGSAPVSPEAVRAALLGPGGNNGSISRQDSDVIDLISMLFESILDDRAVPDSVRVLLARLQIPMLKVALADRSFFSKPRHPARRLLNMLAKAGIGLDDSMGAESNPWLGEIERVVSTVLENLTDDLGLFETLADEFEGFQAQLTEREMVAVKRQTIGIRTKEAKEQIRIAVQRKLDEFFAVQPVPAPVGELLRGPWTEVLIATRLLKDHAIWAARTQMIRELIDSVTPKKSREERLAMPPVIARILPGLRSGLGAIGWSAEQVDGVIAMLEPYHLAVVHGRPLPVESAPDDHAAIIAEVTAQLDQVQQAEAQRGQRVVNVEQDGPIGEEIVLATEDLGPGSGPRQENGPADEYLQLARTYQVGTWFTFTQPDGKTRRAKLTWKSTLLDECIFLDWRMRMVADLNMAQFASGLRETTISELQDTPLFERAMEALMGRLRKQSS